MRNKLSIKFYQLINKESNVKGMLPIYMRITLNRKKAELHTGFSDYSDALSIPYGDGSIPYIYISNGVVDGDYATPADNTILYPDQTLIINNSYNVSVTLFGELAFADNIVN
jgi:hypothetical protein